MTPLQAANEAYADRLIEERRVFRAVFFGEAGRYSRDAEAVMKHLEKFCYVNKSTLKVSPQTAVVDPLATAAAEGRREVYLRIRELLEASDEKFNAMIEHIRNSNKDEE